MSEACQILNISPPAKGKIDMEKVTERFKKLFDLNDPKKGGSFYLQSKILRARERIEFEMRNEKELDSMHDEARKGWNPKLYKD
jgi:mitochondrial import inner membrane translocase subunit TIM16